ncbi:MAG: efflux RND transporter permease subunit [Bacteroidota bacterium]|nr:multidrug efflux pump protein [Odoribacter sp.]MDP3642547.1 efflux RND transporter permease subunit [Bacteroidota bacterium]
MNPAPKYRPSSFSILIIFILLMIVGVSLLPLLNLQLTPSRSLPGLSVSYSWPDASARVIEQEVTSRLEGLFSGVKGIKEVSSVSSKGYGRISLSFKKTVNLDAARFEVSSLIRQAYPNLPEQVSFPELSMSASGQNTSPILTYTLNASASPFFIQKYAEDHLVPKLSVIPGVNGVKVFGSTPYEWEIRFNNQQAQLFGIRSSEIAQSVSTFFNEEYLGQGTLSTTVKETITGFYLRYNKSDSINWRSIPVKKVNGRVVHLGDIATITYKEQQASSYFRINGLNTINLVVFPDDNVNNLSLGKLVKEEVERLGLELPSGYSLLLTNDTTQFLNKELNKIGLRTIFSLLILLTFVLLISRQFKYLLLITISIVANLVIACIFYYVLGIEIHLYTLAGITISFGMVIDSSIIMIDHIHHQGNRKAFLAILAATLTTIGAMSVIFFLKEEQKINLIEFAQVIIVNLTVSLGISLFLIPALMEKVILKKQGTRRSFRRKRRALRITRVYSQFIRFSKRYKWAYLVLFVLGFGLPVQWLPQKIEKEGTWAEWYNKSVGNDWVSENIRPIAEKILGGSLRLFSEYVFENSFYSEPSRTTLYAHGKMPEGCTVQQLNDAVMLMENFLSKFDEIEMFQTSITAYNNSAITVQFKPEYEFSSFPYFLKEEITSKAISLGGMDWDVYGVGRGFSNSLNSGYKNSQIILEGYNYDQLYRYAEQLKRRLGENERVKEVEISGSSGWNVKTLYEYAIDFNHEGLGLNEVEIIQFYSFLKDKVYKANLSPVYANNELQPVSLVSDSYGRFNVWDLNNRPVSIGEKQFKLSSFGTIGKQKSGNDIHKTNQQYQLVVAYDFIGPEPLSKMVRERHEKELSDILPMGYSVRKFEWGGWDKKDKNQYFLILLVIVIIYFICSILLESLLQPFAIIFMIPISFIGVFLTFYLFDFNFDQGGFASFILLCGIVVNAGLYIINDYNNFCRAKGAKNDLTLYLKAFNHKIIPVFLTIISTVLSLVPFVWSGQKEVFWFAFAIGAIGGLIFSIVAILFYLPLFIRFNK